MSGPRREDEPEWGVLTYNLALAKFQQRHILQVPVIFLLPLFMQIDIWSLIILLVITVFDARGSMESSELHI